MSHPRTMKRLLIAVSSMTLVVAAAVFPAETAHASQTEITDSSAGDTLSMNNWFNHGLNNPVKLWTEGKSNEAFIIEPIRRCQGGSTVTLNCPFGDVNLDTAFLGDEIFQIVYSNGYCVSTASSGNIQLGNCNQTSNGTGGANGTVQVCSNTVCDAGSGAAIYINIYWTNKDNGAENCIDSADSASSAIWENSIGVCDLWTAHV